MRRLAASLAILTMLGVAACSGGGSGAEQTPVTTDAAEVSLPAEADVFTEVSGDGTIEEVDVTEPGDASSNVTGASSEVATFGAGCFWCVEAVLEQVDGVTDVSSGYMGGEVENPTYRDVCMGTTGHAEVVQVTFDPSVISYDQMLDWFFQLHDPTTLNQQGADTGTQYRSAIFYHSDAQRVAAEAAKQTAQADFRSPIVTEITAADTYYLGEDDHQDYYRLNKQQGYCRAVIAPKLRKLDLKD